MVHQRMTPTLLALALAAASGLAWLLRRQLVGPVERLTAAVARIASGNLDERAPVRGFSEYRDLAVNFNAMAEQLVVELQNWCQRAEASGIQALQEFSLKLRAAHA